MVVTASGREAMKQNTALFVIQRHTMPHLHYDLRLEMDGVLKSWAVPKQPPRKKHLKRLAIQTEDHALAYATIEGVISRQGHRVERVERWDMGIYELEGRGRGIIVVHLKGNKLQGRYSLVRLNGQKKQWLFFKC